MGSNSTPRKPRGWPKPVGYGLSEAVEFSIHHIQLCYCARKVVEWPSKKSWDYNNPNRVLHFYLVILYCKMYREHKSLFFRQASWLHAYRFLVTSPLPAPAPWSMISFISLCTMCPINPYQCKYRWLESTEIPCNPYIIHQADLQRAETANSIL